jgi:hypothetical protein
MTTASVGGIDVAWEDPGLALFSRTLDEVGSQRAALLSQWFAKYQRTGASPRVVQTFPRAFLEADVSIIWETPELVLDQVEELLTRVRRIAEPTRMLAATPSRPADKLGPQTLASIWVATPPDEPLTEEAQVEVVSTWRSKVRSWW